MKPRLRPANPANTASKERLRLWLRVLTVHRRIEAQLRERLRLEFGTTLPRFDVLAALYRVPEGMKMSELSRKLIVSNGNVTGIVDRLADDGFVLREAVPEDRRAARVKLTQKGFREFAEQAEAHENWVSELLSGVDEENAANTAHMLQAALTLNAN